MRLYNFPQNKKILIVQAHPDDADFYCGGTVAKLSELRNEVIYIICTNGDKGSQDKNLIPKKLAKIREKEQKNANEILKVKESIFLNYPDLHLKIYEDKLREDLAIIYRKIAPDILITFDPWCSYEFHPDHTVCGECALHSRLIAKMQYGVRKYTPHNIKEIWLFKTQNPNTTVNITKYINVKYSALLCHKTQFLNRIITPSKLKEMLVKINYNKKSKKYVEKFKIIFIEGFLY